MEFSHYLRGKQYRKSSISSHLQSLGYFEKWCNTMRLSLSAVQTKDILEYIEYCYNSGVQKQTVRLRIGSIKLYFDMLVCIEEIDKNPALRIRIKNIKKKVFKQTYTQEQHAALYREFTAVQPWQHRTPQDREAHMRSAVLLGFLLFQGLRTMELAGLEKSDIHLPTASMYVPAKARSNSRTLALNALQIVYLQAYLNKLETTINKGGNDMKLFSENHISNQLQLLKRQLQNPKLSIQFQNLESIRQSVVVSWLKENNIRKVQYMAGHKYISSTERYKQQDLSSLQMQLDLFHPLNVH